MAAAATGDRLEQMLCTFAPEIVHWEYRTFIDRFILRGSEIEYPLLPMTLEAPLRVLYENRLAEASRPDLQMLFERAFMLVGLQIVDDYQTYWLQKATDARTFARMDKLFRAVSVGINLCLSSCEFLDRKTLGFTLRINGHWAEFVSMMQSTYYFGCFYVDHTWADFEDVIRYQEIASSQFYGHPAQQRILGHRCWVPDADERLARMPSQRLLYIGNVKRTELLRRLLVCANAEERKAITTDVLERGVSLERFEVSGSYWTFAGHRIYVESLGPAVQFIDAIKNDGHAGFGATELLVTGLSMRAIGATH